jgi:mRNA interferase HigB
MIGVFADAPRRCQWTHRNLCSIIDRTMHVISRKALRNFWQRHADSEGPLRRWHKLMTTTDFASFSELRETFPSADMVNELIVFNIGGNKYRLVASVHFNCRKVYVRHVLTHVEYDQGNWKQ